MSNSPNNSDNDTEGYEVVNRKHKKNRNKSNNLNIMKNKENFRDNTHSYKEGKWRGTAINVSSVNVVECSANRLENNDHDIITIDGEMKAPPTVLITTPEKEIPEATNESETQAEEKELSEQETSPSELIYNTRALSKTASTYELEKFEKNALIIFNQENIDGYKKRLGTEKDVMALEKTFKKYGFEVKERKDRTKEELFRELEEFSNNDFTDYGCVAVAILTHGSKQGLLRAKDQPYSETEIINHFLYKPLLITKPILLIIQACRGTKQTAGVMVHTAGRIQKDLDEEVEPYTLPVESDMLILHSSYVGKPSHRNELHGSWFIQSLCSKIDELSDTLDLESILAEVKREVAIDRYHREYNRRTSEMDINKQMPVTTSTLIRKLYLKKFGDATIDCRIMSNLRQTSRNEVLDSTAPKTPLLVQFGPCACFLRHFDYIKECLRYFLDENPDDVTAQGFLNVANTFENGVEFNTSKEVMLRTICNHLMTHAKSSEYFKYLHLYKN